MRSISTMAERGVVRLMEAGDVVSPVVVAYINRVSDLLWLLAQQLEHRAGINASLRDQTGKAGNRFSRAW